ncbi:MAG: branched-chain alpha-keto acid dehydrogenase subunit E2 [Nitrospira sp. WS110]|nr:branched-chain alpha-keto acid dehydrogenase subunit E2 [Nitrospira sp. WS110]
MNVELPFLAEGIEGGDVVQLLVREGDHVKEGQSLIELETDKATVSVPTPATGTVVRLLVQQGDHVKVGQALIELDRSDDNAKQASTSSSTKPTKPSPQQTLPTAEAGQAKAGQSASQREASSNVPPPEPVEPAVKEKTGAIHLPSAGATIPAPPSVRRLARELGVDLSQVKGSEAGGRITADDVKAFVRERTKRGSAQGVGSNIFSTAYGSERREPLPSLRRKIAANMTQAWTTIPHVHQFQDADITDLMALHKRYAPEFKKKGATLTLSSLFLKAIVHALKLYPQMNATLDLTNGEVIYKDYYNIGVAVDTPAGLIVPVVHQVDQKDLLQISLELADLAERTRKREIKLEELRGATFTLSNMGGLGAGPFLPIINPPQVGILGVGKAKMTPVYRDGQFVPRRVLQLSVGYDHRLVDGAIGARFTNEIVKVLEDFQGMFLGL